ncbi:hypothetical protein MSAN_00454300 [Mycena sanguinolenta]|uniref:Uncharacterized protein n=1 Tax=Mycena sanguinolenta TaxID=230812 RepID=A0A8H6ZDZ8_9AGAR|nr:hypothetical protein MSAN_00454300 [Mycena sanguinolenta]
MPTPTPAISEEERVGTPMDEDHGGVTSTAGGSGAATAAPSSTSTTQATTPTNSTPSPATAHPRNRTCPPSPSPAPISTSTSPTSPPPSPGAGTSTSAAGAGTSPSTLIPTGRTSPSPSISAPARSLSPDDFAPSPFAPPAFPVPEELSPLAPSSAPISTPGTGAASGAMGSGAGLVGPGQAAPFAPAHDSTPVLDPLGFTGPGPGPLLVDTMLAHGIAPGPPVSPDWPLPHAPFALPSLSLPSGSGSVSSAAGPSTALYGSSGAQQGYGLFAASAYASGSSSASHFSPGLHFPTSQQQQAPPPTPAERHSRAVEWSALLERRRLAGERALADEREAEERRRAGERWVGEWGVPVGRGVRVERSKAPAVGSGAEGSGQGGGEAQGPEDVEMPMSVPPQGEVDYVPEDAYAEEDYSRMRRRSPLCIVSSAPRSEDTPPSPLVLSPDTSLSTPEVQQQEQTQHLAPEDAPVPQNVNGNGNGPRTDLVYEVQPQLRKQDDDLGPDPATRMNTAWGPWKIACRTRVWDVRQRYTPSLIRSLVAQEADDYFSSHGLPHPDSLLFMDEEYYDWELEESASEGEGDGSGDGSGSGEDESFEVDPAQQQQSFVLEPSHLSPTSPRSPSSPRDSGANSENEDADADADGEAGMEMDLAANGMGGVLSSFYIAPQQQAHFPPQMQMPMHLPPLPLPPPPLASVRVPVLRHFFTDIPITPAGGEGAVRGRGTPIDYARKAAWGGGKVGGDAGEIGEGEVGADLGRGTLERRQPHPRPRPHPMYLAMARAAEAERAQYGGGEGGPVEGVADQDLPPMPRLREPGEPPMLPMRGLKDLEFLKSVGVESTTVAATGEDGRDAMDVDAGQQNSIDADADADSDPDYDIEESGGAGGTSGGVALGLPPASISSTPGSSSGSMLSGGVGMGVEMSIGMFGMAMGAMGMGGWFTGPPSPPVPVAVGDGGGERERESSLSFALGV